MLENENHLKANPNLTPAHSLVLVDLFKWAAAELQGCQEQSEHEINDELLSIVSVTIKAWQPIK